MNLPISPKLVWDDNIKKLDTIITPAESSHRYNKVEGLQDIYRKNFKKYGIGTEIGSVTVFHSSRWLLYTLVYNMQYNKNLSMLLGTLGSFEEPYINYYELMLKQGLNTRIIYDQEDLGARKRVKNIIKFIENYPQKIEIKSNVIGGLEVHSHGGIVVCMPINTYPIHVSLAATLSSCEEVSPAFFFPLVCSSRL
jgi:hypothetical protein